jgi:lipopolysaccharide transport system permease protein
MGFIASEAMIKQISLPLYTHILRVFWRHLTIFAHNLVILPIVLLLFWKPLPAEG